MLVRDGGRVTPVTERVSFESWLRGDAPFARRPVLADLDYHLTTLFPPVRPRGYLEIRCLDAVPDRWWPALAGITAVLVDDPVAADIAAETCERLGETWTTAARDGLANPVLADAANRCLAVAAERCPPTLSVEVQQFAAAVADGRGPASELRDRVATRGSTAVLAEEADAY